MIAFTEIYLDSCEASESKKVHALEVRILQQAETSK